MTRAIDLMTEDPVTVTASSTVGEAMQILQELNVRHIPVVNQSNELVGMLSDRDLRAVSVPRTIDEEWLGELRIALETPVARVMSSNVVTVQEEASMPEVIELMLDNKIGAVPVVDADSALVGIISYIDVLRELHDLDAAE
jgi:acetoin utilization protein AcuB